MQKEIFVTETGKVFLMDNVEQNDKDAGVDDLYAELARLLLKDIKNSEQESKS